MRPEVTSEYAALSYKCSWPLRLACGRPLLEYAAFSYKCGWPLRLDLEAEDDAEEMRAVIVKEEATAALR